MHIFVQNIKERHVNNDDFGVPNPNNQMEVDRNSANQIIAERHQDTGESQDNDYREKANGDEQEVGENKHAGMALDNIDNDDAGQKGDNIQGADFEDDKGKYKNDDYGDQNDRDVAQEQVKQEEGYKDGDKDDGMGE